MSSMSGWRSWRQSSCRIVRLAAFICAFGGSGGLVCFWRMLTCHALCPYSRDASIQALHFRPQGMEAGIALRTVYGCSIHYRYDADGVLAIPLYGRARPWLATGTCSVYLPEKSECRSVTYTTS